MKTGWLLFLLLLLFALGMAKADIVSEKQFADHGVRTFTLTGPEDSGCVDVQFLRSEEELMEGNQQLLSLHAEFKPTWRGEALVEAYLNDELLQELGPATGFADKWARIPLP